MSRKRIGCRIITCNRAESFQRLLRSLEGINLNAIVIVNDGAEMASVVGAEVITNEFNLGVGRSKNKALKYLLEKGCDHIFLIEDDVYVKDCTVFDRYIEASERSGIQHLNFSQHGNLNRKKSGAPKPIARVVSGGAELDIYKHCVGAFSYYSRKCLGTVGLIDERYFNALEHVDHTYEIIKAGMHPSFWTFADIAESNEYIGDEAWSVEQSNISSRADHEASVVAALEIFRGKHGVVPSEIPMLGMDELIDQLDRIGRTLSCNEGLAGASLLRTY